jgi:hypothetical protein
VVGTGSAASCTDAALNTELTGGGLVTFNCGGGLVTIDISPAAGSTGTKSIAVDTTIDGGSLITISGGNSVRVFSVNTSVKFTVQNLIVANGNSADYGGGIWNGSGTLTVTNSTFSGNSAYYCGGGIINEAGTLTVTNSTFSGNSAYCGGGIYNHNGGTLTVTNSTFSGNSATAGVGGAINNANCGDAGNAPCPATLRNTIVANSTLGGNCAGTIIDGGHNLDDGTGCGFSTASGSLNNTDPKLDPAGLANNGGPTQTIALCTGTGTPSAGCTGASPGINAGDESVCSTTTGTAPVDNLDQRGFVRPGTGATNCSIGAFEVNSPGPPPACTGDCRGDNRVTVDEILTMVNIALGNAEMSECDIGDSNNDGQITVDEILQAVNNALNGCPLTPAEQGCLTSGGTVTKATCCASTSDFPDTCAIGACGCPPDTSHEVRVCNCAAGSCFDGTACVGR